MQKGVRADRADLPVAEKSRQRPGSENFRDQAGVMIRNAEESLPAAVAGKEQRGKGPDEVVVVRCDAQLAQILVRRVAIAELILQRLADARDRTDRDRARRLIRVEDVADEKISTLEFLEILRDSQAREEIAPRPQTLALG